MFEDEIFWKENWQGDAKGGIMFRSFDLNKFIKLVEKKDEVVGIKFDGNNLELIVSKQPEDYE
tara:strand:- start:634 stop:822 length:189 start_codon:yes stop_codon:yes gene_type:complete